MALKQDLYGGFQLGCFVFEVGTRTASRLNSSEKYLRSLVITSSDSDIIPIGTVH